jgi:hypothetical protein
MPETQRSENFSFAYIRAIAAHAGLDVFRAENDLGIDISFVTTTAYQTLSLKRGKRLLVDPHAMPLHFQVKSTKNWIFVDDMVRCRLEAKAYDDAVYARGALPLLMMCLPATFDEWLGQDEMCLQLRNCCYYWKPSASDTMTRNDSSKTILIPRAQKFTPQALTELYMARQRGIPS